MRGSRRDAGSGELARLRRRSRRRMKYSPLTDITRDNVAPAPQAWKWRTGERRPRLRRHRTRPGYSGHAAHDRRHALPHHTLQPAWWRSTPRPGASSGATIPGPTPLASRPTARASCIAGVAAWSDGTRPADLPQLPLAADRARRRHREADPFLRQNGEIDLTAGLIHSVNQLHYTNTSPPVVWRDLVILGNGVGDRLDLPGRSARRRPGVRRAHRASAVWRFETDPAPGESGNDTWEDGSWRRPATPMSGRRSPWTPRAGCVYLPVEHAEQRLVRRRAEGRQLFAESVVCLDARTGRRVWHFQIVHHGLWDYDLPAPPVAGDGAADGQTSDVVAVPDQAGIPLRLRPRDRQAGLADRGAPRAGERRARRARLAHPAIPHQAASRSPAGLPEAT